MIDEEGQHMGVQKREDALKTAEEKGLDLIEVAPQAAPPVAKLMSFDKFRYQEEKKERKQRHAQKAKELKHVRLTPRAARNDLQIKANQAGEFLSHGHTVEINLFLRGREKFNREWSLKKLREFLTMIPVPYLITMEPRPGHRGFVAQVAAKKQ